MSPPVILLLYLLLTLLASTGEAVLIVVHMRHVAAHASVVPPAFAPVVDGATHARSASYTVARGRLSLAAGVVSTAAALAAALTGFLGLLDTAVRTLPVHPFLQGALFLGCLSGLSWLLGLPFSIFATFSVERKFGFNVTPPALFLLDALKGLALAAAVGLPLLLGLFWMIDAAGRMWWAWAFLGLSAFQLVMMVLYPLVIAPVFNRFTPLPDGPLRTAILALARQLGVRASGVFVMDGSRRSRHSNAYFTGLGRAKRIVLFDTLVASSPQEEVLAVLAHEMGHERKHHLAARFAVSLAGWAAGFWIAGQLLGWQPLFHAFGMSAPSSHGLVALLALCARPLGFFLASPASTWSRRHEYQADRFAAQALGSSSAMREVLLRLARDNLSTLTPHPLYSLFYYSHPTLARRIASLDSLDTRPRRQTHE